MQVAAGTQVLTFLLIGDQNSGKSTFLHSFCRHGDPDFLVLQSLLPILSATFTNARFLWMDDERPPIDEPPFLDTDLGRATMVLTADDFAFFVSEHNLDPALVLNAPPGTIYFAIQVIEFGGDHLDQLMDPSLIRNANIRDIVQKSSALLCECERIVYFVNGRDLLGSGHGLDLSVLDRLLGRLRHLGTVMPPQTSAMIHITRTSALVVSPARLVAAAQQLQDHLSLETPLPAVDNMAELLEAALARANLAIQITNVYCSDHVQADGSLDVSAVVTTLSRMFREEMLHSASDARHLLPKHILDAYTDVNLRFAEDGSFDLWLSRDAFQGYLEKADIAEVPDAHALQAFDAVAQQLGAKGLALCHHAANHADLALRLITPDGNELAYHPGEGLLQPQTGQDVRVRFPSAPGFLPALAAYMTRGVPGELWLAGAHAFDAERDYGVMQNLRAVREALTADVRARWTALISALEAPTAATDAEPAPSVARADTAVMAQTDARVDESDLAERCWHRFVWAVEEQCQLHFLLQHSPAYEATDHDHTLPLPRSAAAPLTDLIAAVASRSKLDNANAAAAHSTAEAARPAEDGMVVVTRPSQAAQLGLDEREPAVAGAKGVAAAQQDAVATETVLPAYTATFRLGWM